MISKAKKLLRPMAHLMREGALYFALLYGPKKLTILVFQPHGRFGGSLLRAYKIAEGLNRRGWRAVVVPEQLKTSQRERLLRIFAPDIALLHKSRDARNSHELLQDVPYVYDLDDGDFHNPKLVERMEKDVSNSIGVIAGSQYAADWCKHHNPNTRVIWTGSEPRRIPANKHANRGQLVAWAQSTPTKYLNEFDFIVTVMKGLAKRCPDLTLRLYGNAEAEDGGRSEELRQAGVQVEWLPFLNYEEFVMSLSDVAVGFSPICAQSPFVRGKSFGKLLAYFDAFVPAVVSDEGDHAIFFEPGSGIVSNDPEVWINETAALLASSEWRDEMARKAHDIYLRELSLDVVVEKVESFLLECLEEHKGNQALPL